MTLERVLALVDALADGEPLGLTYAETRFLDYYFGCSPTHHVTDHTHHYFVRTGHTHRVVIIPDGWAQQLDDVNQMITNLLMGWCWNHSWLHPARGQYYGPR